MEHTDEYDGKHDKEREEEHCKKHNDENTPTESHIDYQNKWLSDLIKAIENDDWRKVLALVKDEKDLSFKFDYFLSPNNDFYDRELTPLILASALGKLEAVKALLHRDTVCFV